MKLSSNSHEDTENIGFKLGEILKEGDVVGLYGDLGTGKTTMVKGIARAFGIDSKDVTSASFTIIAEYNSEPTFYHIDLYRVNKGDDLDNTGIWDCIGQHSISVIEWAEKLEEGIPANAIKVYLETGGNQLRNIIIEGIDEKNWNNL